MSVLPPEGLTGVVIYFKSRLRKHPKWIQSIRFTPSGSDRGGQLLQKYASGVSKIDSECPFYPPEGLTEVNMYPKSMIQEYPKMDSECPFYPQRVWQKVVLMKFEKVVKSSLD